MAAPNANAKERGMAGTSACSTAPVEKAMANTRPTAKEMMPKRFFQSAAGSAWRDSLKCSGAMKRMSRSSGSRPLSSGVATKKPMSAPSAICTSGSDSGRTSLSKMLEATTAASRNNTDSSAATRASFPSVRKRRF